jgi:urea carboxylase
MEQATAKRETMEQLLAAFDANTARVKELCSHALPPILTLLSLYQTLPAAAPFSPDDAILYRSNTEVNGNADGNGSAATNGNAGTNAEALCLRQSGEDSVLVEYGAMKLDIRLRFRVHVLMQELEKSGLPYIDLTPGVRSLQVHFDPAAVTMQEVARQVLAADAALPELTNIEVPSRIVHLPLSWDDPQTQLAAQRYKENTRPDAPWCPSNLEFIRRINGLDSIKDVHRIFFDASYLVLGLGDVYLGAPVATPVDPRHRLVTTKYNPARPWTPENAVGIGGSYLCVYGMEGPGGYQLVGRTTQMWNRLQSTDSFREGKPWLLDFFDQLQFYPVSATELLAMREDCLRGRFNVRIEQTTFSLGSYLDFLENNQTSIKAFKEHQEAAFAAEHQRWVRDGLDTFVSASAEQQTFVEQDVPPGCVSVRSAIAGMVWKCVAEAGQQVEAGQPVVVLESMKMEFAVEAPCSGTVEHIYVTAGSKVDCGQMIACIKPVGGESAA